jgi:hypothetical protein
MRYVYTITVTCTDAAGNQTVKTTTVHVGHNITGPSSGSAFKVGTPVNFSGEFWDVAGLTHSGTWTFDNLTTAATVVEPAALRSGTARTTYTFDAAGVYLITLKLTDNLGGLSWVNTAGDVEAIVAIYDPSGGHTIGGGWVNAPAGAYRDNSALAGKLAFGFQSKYFKNATNPKGEAQVNFQMGRFSFNALNYDYLAVSGSRAQFKGFGKVNGEAGYNFILTVIDGQAPNGGGIDKFRIKIWNKLNGQVVYDTQPGASDAATPNLAVSGGGITIVP